MQWCLAAPCVSSTGATAVERTRPRCLTLRLATYLQRQHRTSSNMLPSGSAVPLPRRRCGRLFRSYELGRSNTARSAVTLRAVKLHIAELSAHTRGTARRRNGLRRSGTLNCSNGEDSSEEGVVGRGICPPSSEGAVHPSTCCCRNRPRRDRVVATYLRRPSRREHVSA
ncbi:hypothetical protein PR003_g8387 [Phytophthora rubi]|uniref:Uncharacterized protein n=1 Tax=Phytophthora rubi TaxID=129364 RepID=A0A6A3NB55_9STRA|nr:hypothetical protein PR002_g7952 [Phytophthora rubi]KAE9039179.1 hypothetical protein PR001_g7623 [Phytophthora rubi]KAE9344593.1 hypothetical protein PR003_g8387 [Phytophthora rubi]